MPIQISNGTESGKKFNERVIAPVVGSWYTRHRAVSVVTLIRITRITTTHNSQHIADDRPENQ